MHPSTIHPLPSPLKCGCWIGDCRRMATTTNVLVKNGKTRRVILLREKIFATFSTSSPPYSLTHRLSNPGHSLHKQTQPPSTLSLTIPRTTTTNPIESNVRCRANIICTRSEILYVCVQCSKLNIEQQQEWDKQAGGGGDKHEIELYDK